MKYEIYLQHKNNNIIKYPYGIDLCKKYTLSILFSA